MKDEDDNIVAIDSSTKSGRGGYRKNANFPQVRRGFGDSDEDKALVSKLLSETLIAYRQPKVKDDKELSERLDNYFKMCAETGQIPTVEEMVMNTGYTYAAWYDWETGRRQGFSAETANIIKKAKEYLKTFDAKLVTTGKLNFLTYCFRGKQYYNFVDKQEITITPNGQNESELPAEDIAKRYIEDGRTVETEFAEN